MSLRRCAFDPFPIEVQRDWVDRAGNRRRFDELIEPFMLQPIAPDVGVRLDRFLDTAVVVPAVALDETLTMATRRTFADRVGELDLPILAIGGMRDPVLGPDIVVRWLDGELPHARRAFVDCSHDIPIERPQELANLIEAFLAGMNA